jgi:hypothetical protein
MTKTFVALLTLLLVLVGPAAAQDPEPPEEGSGPENGSPPERPQDSRGPDDASGPEEGSGEGSADAGSENSTASAQSGESPEASPGSETQAATSAQGHGERACRAVATHIADPKVSPARWVIVDPDGCFRRTVDRLIPPAGKGLIGNLL